MWSERCPACKKEFFTHGRYIGQTSETCSKCGHEFSVDGGNDGCWDVRSDPTLNFIAQAFNSAFTNKDNA